MQCLVKYFVSVLFIFIFLSLVACENPQGNSVEYDSAERYSMEIIMDIGFENYDTHSGLVSNAKLLLIENPTNLESAYKCCICTNNTIIEKRFSIPEKYTIIDSAIGLEDDNEIFYFLCFCEDNNTYNYSLQIYNSASNKPIGSISLQDCGITEINDIPKICSSRTRYFIVYSTSKIWILDKENHRLIVSKGIEKIREVWCCEDNLIVSTYYDDNYDSITCYDYNFHELSSTQLSKGVLGNYNILSYDANELYICTEIGVYSFSIKSKEYNVCIIFEQYAMKEPICVGITDNNKIMLCANFLLSDDCDMGSYKWVCLSPNTKSVNQESINICIMYDNGFYNETICELFGAMYGYNVEISFLSYEDEIEGFISNGNVDSYNSLLAEVVKSKADIIYIPSGDYKIATGFADVVSLPIYKYDCCVCDSQIGDINENFFKKLDPISYNRLCGSHLSFAYLDNVDVVKELLYYNKYPEELTSEIKYISNFNVEEYLSYKIRGYVFLGLPGNETNRVHRESIGYYCFKDPVNSSKKLSDFRDFIMSEEFSSFFNTNTIGMFTDYEKTNKCIIEFNLRMIDEGFICNDLFCVGIISQKSSEYEQDLLCIINDSKIYPFADNAISTIFNEESLAYVNNITDLDEAADMYISRVKRYLAESE